MERRGKEIGERREREGPRGRGERRERREERREELFECVVSFLFVVAYHED